MIKCIKTFNVILAMILTLGASAAIADANNGAYVGVGAGYGEIYSHDIASLNKSSGGFAYALNAGYLWNVERFSYGAELSFNGFPETKYDYPSNLGSASVNANSINLMAVGQVYVGNNISFLAKAGGAIAMDTFTSTGSNDSDKTNLQPAVAAGVSYAFNQNISANVTGLYVFGDQNSDVNEGLNKPLMSVLAGLTYSF